MKTVTRRLPARNDEIPPEFCNNIVYLPVICMKELRISTLASLAEFIRLIGGSTIKSKLGDVVHKPHREASKTAQNGYAHV